VSAGDYRAVAVRIRQELVDVLPATFAAVRSRLADFADALEAIARS
jgi:hypothetical protein